MPDTVQAIADAMLAHPLPVLLADACALLDIIRHPIRPVGYDYRIASEASELARRAAARPREMWFALAQTAFREWDRLHDGAEAEAVRGIEALQSGLQHVSDVVRNLDGNVISVAPLTTFALGSRLHTVAKTLVDEAQVISLDGETSLAAADRRHRGDAPARKGVKGDRFANDCEIYEQYLAIGRLLRQNGFAPPIVMVTSNTNDFGDPRASTNPVFQETRANGLIYVADLVWARHCLDGGAPPP